MAVPTGSGGGGRPMATTCASFRYQSGATPAEDLFGSGVGGRARRYCWPAVGRPRSPPPTSIATAGSICWWRAAATRRCACSATRRLPGSVPGVGAGRRVCRGARLAVAARSGRNRGVCSSPTSTATAASDAAVMVEFTSSLGGQRSTTVATYLSSGTGELVGPRFRVATAVWATATRGSRVILGDWNRDGVPDLFLGWKHVRARRHQSARAVRRHALTRAAVGSVIHRDLARGDNPRVAGTPAAGSCRLQGGRRLPPYQAMADACFSVCQWRCCACRQRRSRRSSSASKSKRSVAVRTDPVAPAGIAFGDIDGDGRDRPVRGELPELRQQRSGPPVAERRPRRVRGRHRQVRWSRIWRTRRSRCCSTPTVTATSTCCRGTKVRSACCRTTAAACSPM